MSTPVDISVVIPVFNRSDIIRYTLESVRRASVGLNVETIDSWHRLPRDFPPEYSARQLTIWRRLAPAGPLERLGGRYFRGLARLLGRMSAGRIIRRIQNGPYAACWTMSDGDFQALPGVLPQP